MITLELGRHLHSCGGKRLPISGKKRTNDWIKERDENPKARRNLGALGRNRSAKLDEVVRARARVCVLAHVVVGAQARVGVRVLQVCVSACGCDSKCVRTVCVRLCVCTRARVARLGGGATVRAVVESALRSVHTGSTTGCGRLRRAFRSRAVGFPFTFSPEDPDCPTLVANK